MPIIDFSQDDLNRGKVVRPSWYRVQLGNFAEKMSNAGDSTNWIYEDSRILFDAEDGSKDYEGVLVAVRFNSKAKGFLIGFLSALGETVAAGSRFELRNLEGKQLDIFIGNKEYEGRLINNVENKYRAINQTA